MNIESHIEALSKRHTELKAEIHFAHMHHLPEGELKKKKLLVKDEIKRLSALVNNDNQKQEAA